MLQSCVSFSFFFGIFYGFVLLMDTPGYRKYLLGLWQFESYKHILAKIIISAICALLPMGIFQQISHHFFVEPIWKYILLSFGTMFFGLGLAYFTPIIT